MDPGSVAGVLVYENLWAAPFASAMRRAGGQLIANGRIPIQAIIAAVEADEADRSKQKESDMPLGPGRRGVGVIGGPVAKAAVVGAAVRPARRPSPRPRSSAPPWAPALAGRQGRRRRGRRDTGPAALLGAPGSALLSRVARSGRSGRAHRG